MIWNLEIWKTSVRMNGVTNDVLDFASTFDYAGLPEEVRYTTRYMVQYIVLTFTRTTWRPENVVTGSDENTTRFVRFIPSFSGDDSLSRVSRHTSIRRRSPKLLDYSAWSTDRRKTGIPKSAAPLH